MFYLFTCIHLTRLPVYCYSLHFNSRSLLLYWSCKLKVNANEDNTSVLASRDQIYCSFIPIRDEIFLSVPAAFYCQYELFHYRSTWAFRHVTPVILLIWNGNSKIVQNLNFRQSDMKHEYAPLAIRIMIAINSSKQKKLWLQFNCVGE